MPGVLKSFAGLSASVFTAVYLAAFRPDAAAFLACLAAAPALLAAVALPLFNAVPFLQDACAEAPRVAGALLAPAPCLPGWQLGFMRDHQNALKVLRKGLLQMGRQGTPVQPPHAHHIV